MAGIKDLRKRREVNQQAMNESMQKYKDLAKEVIQQSSVFDLTMIKKSGSKAEITPEQMDSFAEEISKKVISLVMSPVEAYLQRLANANLNGDQIESVTENVYRKVLNDESYAGLSADVSYEEKLEVVAEFFERKPYLYDEVFLFY